MNATTRFVIGVIKGMDGPDLEKLLRDYPAFLGEKCGRLIKKFIDQGGLLNARDEEDLAKTIENEPTKTTVQLVGALVQDSLNSVQETDGGIVDNYLKVLNILTEAMAASGHALVLSGFLHDEHCLTYWDWESTLNQLQEFKQRGGAISPGPLTPQIYLLDGSASDENVIQLNLEIFRHHRLSTVNKHQLKRITHAYVEFGPKFGDAKRYEIPLGAPGIIRMFESLPLALRTQEAPANKLRETLAKLRDSI